MGNDTISAHSVHPIVRAQAPLRLTLVVHTTPGSSSGLHAYSPLVKVLSIVSSAYKVQTYGSCLKFCCTKTV